MWFIFETCLELGKESKHGDEHNFMGSKDYHMLGLLDDDM